MKSIKVAFLLLIMPFCIIAQYNHTSSSGNFALVGSIGQYFYQTHTINATGESYLRIEAYSTATDYGFAQIQIFSHDYQTQYGSIFVSPNQSGVTASESQYFDIPNNCVILLTVLDIAAASITYQAIDNISEIHFSYDQAGNRTGIATVFLYGSSKKSVTNNIDMLSSIEEELLISRQFNVYPNPATQSVFITLNDEAISAETKRILIFDNLGKKVMEREVFEEIEQFDLSSCKSGIYIIKLIYGANSKECLLIKK